jgi:hypothetical protein
MALIGLSVIALGVYWKNNAFLGCGIGLFAYGLIIMCTGIILHAINMAHRESEEYQKKLHRLLRSQKADK